MSDQPAAFPAGEPDRARPERQTAAERRVQETVIISADVKDLIAQAKAEAAPPTVDAPTVDAPADPPAVDAPASTPRVAPTPGADQEFSTLSPTASNALFGATVVVVGIIIVIMVLASILAFFLFLR
jgi:hypothetical protein